MVRSYDELNKLEKRGLMELLKEDGWTPCTLTGPKEGTRKAMSKVIGNKIISVEVEHFHADED